MFTYLLKLHFFYIYIIIKRLPHLTERKNSKRTPFGSKGYAHSSNKGSPQHDTQTSSTGSRVWHRAGTPWLPSGPVSHDAAKRSRSPARAARLGQSFCAGSQSWSRRSVSVLLPHFPPLTFLFKFLSPLDICIPLGEFPHKCTSRLPWV